MIDSAVLIITLGSFVAAFVNGAFATGGIYIMLFASVSVLPISAAVPLQPAFAVASLSARIYLFWQHIDWRIVRLFALGSGVGVILGTRTFVALPEEIIVTLLGFIMLALIWMPKVNWQVPIKHPFLFVGVIHSYLGAIFGVGGVLQPLMLRMPLLKFQITGTLAACMLAMDGFKFIGYGSFGFNYLDYVPHIIGATLAGFAGTWAGKRVTHQVSEKLFRTAFRVLVSIVALQMIYRSLSGA